MLGDRTKESIDFHIYVQLFDHAHLGHFCCDLLGETKSNIGTASGCGAQYAFELFSSACNLNYNEKYLFYGHNSD